MSGFDDSTSKTEISRPPVVGYLQKPFDADELMRAANTLMEHNTPR
jgi:hypothetical protein